MSKLHLFKKILLVFAVLLSAVSIYILQNDQIVEELKAIIEIRAVQLYFSSLNAIQNSNYSKWKITGKYLNSTPSEAFITFSNSNPKYLALLIKTLDAVHLFSTRPIIAYGVDNDLNIDTAKYPRLIKRRISQKDCGPSIFFCKIYCILHSQVDYGIYIESDTLVNWNVDILFDLLHRWPYPLPLSPRHPNDPQNYMKYLRYFGVDLKNRTTPYVHAHILWNYRAYSFFQRAVDLMRQGYFMGANNDETGINILLWQAKTNHTLCLIDPFFITLPSYESNEMLCKEYCHHTYILIHGCKDPNEMENIIQRLKNHTGSPFIQTPRNGFHYLNETEYTCCYPDSRQSSIHPLLCEYQR